MTQDSRSSVIFSPLEDVSCVICLNSSVKKTDGREHRCMGEEKNDTEKIYKKELGTVRVDGKNLSRKGRE